MRHFGLTPDQFLDEVGIRSLLPCPQRCATGRSALPSVTDIDGHACQFRKVPRLTFRNSTEPAGALTLSAIE